MSNNPETSNSGKELVRPKHGRVIAGVCAAIANATNVSVTIVRVVAVVGTIFIGVPIIPLLYIAGWLFMPGEGMSSTNFQRLKASLEERQRSQSGSGQNSPKSTDERFDPYS